MGNLNASGKAFTSCDLSRGQCQERGMFDRDLAGNITKRFAGFEFVPSAIMVRTSGDKTSHLSPLLDNSAKYNDPVPLVYGTGWLKAAVIFARNDGNLTHMEALLGMGTIQSIMKIVVNDVEIPKAVQDEDMTTTGWYNVVTRGDREGGFSLDFTDSNGLPLGDPYGSMSVLSIVVPNRINSGRSLPTVEVLLQGMEIDVYHLDGSFQRTAFTNNPAWVILDILRRCGWSTADLDLASFASASEFCQTLTSTTDLNGNPIQVPRFECNLILTKRQSAAVIVRGIRVGSSLMLRYGWTGLLQLLPETTIAAQQPTLPDGGNSTGDLNGGWPAYEFSDSSAPFSGIVRNSNGASTVRLSSRSIAETSNRLSVEFQDASNEYQQDSFSVVDADDAALIGYEISSQSTALGIANYSQANRVLLRQLDKSTKGNQFVQFQTSFRALKVRPGDIIALTYLKEGFTRVPFRVVKLSPSMNYQVVTVLAQIHDDDWYSDNPAVLGGGGQAAGHACADASASDWNHTAFRCKRKLRIFRFWHYRNHPIAERWRGDRYCKCRFCAAAKTRCEFAKSPASESFAAVQLNGWNS
jgi:Putative phage tail protein